MFCRLFTARALKQVCVVYKSLPQGCRGDPLCQGDEMNHSFSLILVVFVFHPHGAIITKAQLKPLLLRGLICLMSLYLILSADT